MAEVGGDGVAAVTLPEFLSTHAVGSLTVEDRRLVVGQALVVLEQSYSLLSFKVARYGINPLQRLRLLQTQLDRPGPLGPEWVFHSELVDVFNSLRDLHTRYVLPEPFGAAVAVLPFLLKEFTEDGRRRYLVGRRTADQAELGDSFRFGVEITHWNGVPISRAVDRFAERMPGANPAARRARAVDRFTFRSLGFGPPPDDDWVTVQYIDHAGDVQRIELTWLVPNLAALGAAEVPTVVADDIGPLALDVEGAQVARLRTQIYAPEFIAAEASGEPLAAGPDDIAVTPEMSTVFEARRVTVAGGPVLGYLRIRTFMPTDSGIVGFVREFIRLLSELPPDGLVVDVRGNGGGAVLASELSLQALTARRLQPEPAQFAATTLNLRTCRTNATLADWLPSMDQAVESGAPYSAGIAFTPGELLAKVPQSYFGPVVLVTDARCYSATDIFAAGFQDHRIGLVLGTDPSTGAGGANVWRMSNLLGSLGPGAGSPFRPLPGGADLSVAIRRLLRVGPNAGTPLEDYGVVPDDQHLITHQDITNNESDLMAAAAELLARSDPRRFDVELNEAGDELTATFTTLGIDRADMVVDGRPRLTLDLGADPGPAVVPGTGTPQQVEAIGYDNGDIVAARTFIRNGPTLELRTTFTP
jgi:hypothetical protein